MTQPAKVQEPSMEEILASIRRIIADDEATPSSSPAVAKPARPVEAGRIEANRAEANKPEAAKPASLSSAQPPATGASRRQSIIAPSEHGLQDDVDNLLAGLDEDTSEEDVRSASDVLELTEQMAITDQRPFQTVEPSDDLEFAETEDMPEVVVSPRESEPPKPRATRNVEPPQDTVSRPLLSASTMTAVDSAFNSLAQTVLMNNARTLEDLVKEMLRPMLKNWLDDNLPGLVEKIVRAEIERVSRGR